MSYRIYRYSKGISILSSASHELIDRYFLDLLNRGDFSKVDEVLARDFLFQGAGMTTELDRNGFIRYVEELRSAFSNKRFFELDRIVEGNRAAVRFRMTGTQDGPLQGIPPLGVSIDVEGCDLILIRAGKIAEVRAYFDLMAVIQKFLVPPQMKVFGDLVANLWPR